MKRHLVLSLFLALTIASCSDERMVDTGRLPGGGPGIPALTAPPDGAAGQGIPTIVSWKSSTSAISYELQLASDDKFTDICYSARGLTDTTRQVPGLGCATRYWWRVRATNNFGTSAWSASRSFTTYQLDAPLLAQPAHRVADQPLALDLVWNPSDSARNYSVQVSIDSAFSNPRALFVNDSGLTGTSRRVEGLCKTSTYYWRVRAAAGNNYSGWSVPRSFRTIVACETPSVVFDGQTYGTVSIRNQCWLNRNVDAGTMIASVAPAADDGTVEKYCYDDDPSNCATYGGLYSWGEAMEYSDDAGAEGICPHDWRIPTRDDIAKLSAAVCDTSLSRYYVDAVDGGTNESGFSARLAGYRDYGYFGELGDVSKIWLSEVDGAGRALYWVLGRTGYGLVWARADKNAGYSVRCLKNE
jgi:uncharacterized protein (TIGR02145 family)